MIVLLSDMSAVFQQVFHRTVEQTGTIIETIPALHSTVNTKTENIALLNNIKLIKPIIWHSFTQIST